MWTPGQNPLPSLTLHFPTFFAIFKVFFTFSFSIIVMIIAVAIAILRVINLPHAVLTVDSYLLPTSKSRGTKTRTKIKNPAPISFRYCPLI